MESLDQVIKAMPHEGDLTDDDYDRVMVAIQAEAETRLRVHQAETAWWRLQRSLEEEARSFTWIEVASGETAEPVPCIQTFCRDNDLTPAEILWIKDMKIGDSLTAYGWRLRRVAPTLPVRLCPRCGSQAVTLDMNVWSACSVDDPTNNASLVEHQCNDCGGESFWTGSDNGRR